MDMQEPMTLGSPVGHTSPSNTSLHQISGNQFLPGYLMGDPSVATTPVLNRSMSGHLPHSAYANSPVFGHFTPRSSPPSNRPSPGSKFNQLVRSRVHGSASISSKEKGGAPPVSALIEESNQSYPSPGLDVTSSAHRSGLTDLAGRTNPHQYHDVSHTPKFQQSILTPRRIMPSAAQDAGSGHTARTPPSPSQMDPFYTQGEGYTSSIKLDETWVTIFGFPPSASSFILQQFSRCGVIIEHQPAPADGNWMHIHFESKLQARKALSKSGKILPGNLMIGVSPCIDIKVMSGHNQENECPQQRTDITMAPGTPGTPSFQTSITRTPNTSRIGGARPCSIRPLTAAYNAASSGSRVASDVKTPQKTNGIITKTLDYIFG